MCACVARNFRLSVARAPGASHRIASAYLIKGITFNLIIIRVHTGSAPSSGAFTSSTDGDYGGGRAHRPGRTRSGRGQSFGMEFVHGTGGTGGGTLDTHAFSTPAQIGVDIQVTRHADVVVDVDVDVGADSFYAPSSHEDRREWKKGGGLADV